MIDSPLLLENQAIISWEYSAGIPFLDNIFAMAAPGEPSRGKTKIFLRILHTSSIMNSSQINVLKNSKHHMYQELRLPSVKFINLLHVLISCMLILWI